MSSKRIALALALAAAAVGLVGLPGWVQVAGTDPVSGRDITHTFSGHALTPMLWAAALVLVAAGAVTLLAGAGRAVRVLASCVALLAAVLASWQGLAVMTNPVASVRSLSAEVVSVTTWDFTARTTGWVVCAVVVTLTLATAAALTGGLLVGRRPPRRQAGAPAEPTPSPAEPTPPSSEPAPPLAAAHVWDQLDSGQDPTASPPG